MGQRILHVAIADDWEASRNFGEYEVSTRGVGLFDDGYIRATTASGLAEVLRRRYSDLQLPLLLLVIDADALGRAGVNIVWSDPQPGAPASPRIEESCRWTTRSSSPLFPSSASTEASRRRM